MGSFSAEAGGGLAMFGLVQRLLPAEFGDDGFESLASKKKSKVKDQRWCFRRGEIQFNVECHKKLSYTNDSKLSLTLSKEGRHHLGSNINWNAPLPKGW